jgi:hypothetical protein
MLITCTKITLDSRKLLKWHLGSCYWLLVAINYSYTSLSHWWNFWVYNTYFIHFTWNNFHKNALPWFRSWTYAWHYWHPPNIGTRYIHQTSKPKVSLFLLNKFPSSLPLFSQLTNAKDWPFKELSLDCSYIHPNEN